MKKAAAEGRKVCVRSAVIRLGSGLLHLDGFHAGRASTRAHVEPYTSAEVREGEVALTGLYGEIVVVVRVRKTLRRERVNLDLSASDLKIDLSFERHCRCTQSCNRHH